MIVLTKELLEQGKSKKGLWNHRQLRELGIIEIKKGWKEQVIGKEFSKEAISNFLSFKDFHLDKKLNHHQYLEKNTAKKPDHVVLTNEILEKGKSKNGAWSIEQMENFGISKLKKGWKYEIIGKEFSIGAIQRFLYLKDKHLEKNQITNTNSYFDNLFVINKDLPINEQYSHPNWLNLRKNILTRDNNKCKMCQQNNTTLHVHHLMYPKNKFIWEIDEKYLVVVCENCHEKIHDREFSTFNSEIDNNG